MTEKINTTSGHNALGRLLEGLSLHLGKSAACNVPANARIRFEPTDAITLQIVVAGTGFFQLGNGAPLHSKPRTIIIAPARTLQFWFGHHEAGNEIQGPEQCIAVDDELAQIAERGRSEDDLCIVRSEIEVRNRGIAGFFDHLRHPIVETIADHNVAQRTLELLLTMLAGRDMGSRAAAESFMRALLVLLLQQHLQRDDASASVFSVLADPRLARALMNVLERPGERHSLDTLASASGMSRSSFLERFKQVYGQSPSEFVQDLRMTFAAHLLKTSSMPVKAVAASVGYSSRSYFSRAFRIVHSMDPSAYRAAQRR